MESQQLSLLRRMFGAAVASCQPARCMPDHLPPPPKGRTVVIGAGKAAAAMARVIEDLYPGPVSGVVVTTYGNRLRTRRIRVLEAAHPLPDEASVFAAHQMLDAVSSLSGDDQVICLLSGGGSALLALPAQGLSLGDKQVVSEALLRAGAPISEINCVRRHLSSIKGGGLARAAQPAQLVTLAISDVPGDDPINIASGPTVADPTSFQQAREILDTYRIRVPRRVMQYLEAGTDSAPPTEGRYVLVAKPMNALEAASKLARAHNYRPVILGDDIEGEARHVAKVHSKMALSAIDKKERLAIISGGELTVRHERAGRGGPNHEYALALGLAVAFRAGISALAADTDGMDGNSGAAGALVTSGTMLLAPFIGMNPRHALDAHNSGTFFDAIKQQIVTGPTQTNVNDFRAILIDP